MADVGSLRHHHCTYSSDGVTYKPAPMSRGSRMLILKLMPLSSETPEVQDVAWNTKTRPEGTGGRNAKIRDGSVRNTICPIFVGSTKQGLPKLISPRAPIVLWKTRSGGNSARQPSLVGGYLGATWFCPYRYAKMARPGPRWRSSPMLATTVAASLSKPHSSSGPSLFGILSRSPLSRTSMERSKPLTPFSAKAA